MLLEVVISLQENELSVRFLRINGGNHALAPGVAVIKRGAESARYLIVGAQVADIGQPLVTIPGTARIAESVWLKRASAGIPKIGRARQPQRVQFAAQRHLWGRPQVERAIPILVIHHVVKREARVLAWCGQVLK